jgi:NO-binding membrane sensor protein with MHYT domain
LQVDSDTQLALLIAMIGSFTALTHAKSMRARSGRTARMCLIAGCITPALENQSMHLIDMLAFHLMWPALLT